jgi:anti-anti-sigma factor
MIRPSEFKVEIDHDHDRSTIRIDGEIDIGTIKQLEDAREKVFALEPQLVVIDLSAVGFLDSSGLKFLLHTNDLAEERGCGLRIVRPDEAVMKVFTLTGADQRLPFVSSSQP